MNSIYGPLFPAAEFIPASFGFRTLLARSPGAPEHDRQKNLVPLARDEVLISHDCQAPEPAWPL